MKLKFTRDIDRRWYVVLPEWTGDRADLEMVCGADQMLEILGEGRAEVECEFSTKWEDLSGDFHTAFLQLENSDESGGYYKAVFYNRIRSLEVWLCNVTLFVFETSEFPRYIYVK